MLSKIQKELVKDYPQLQKKSDILQYYVSLEYPQKQRKLLSWWEQMINAAVRKSGEIYLSPADLQVIFSFHGLKCVPLQKVLHYLTEKQKLEWEGKPRTEQKQSNTSGGWFGTIANYIWISGNQNQTKSGFKSLQLQQSSKIIPKKYKEQQLSKIKQIILEELKQEKSISYDYVFNRLKKQLGISIHSIQLLLKELEQKNWIITDFVQNKKILFHSPQLKQMRDKGWVQVEKSKYILKTTLSLFDSKIQERINQEGMKLQEVKNCVQIDKNKAKRLLGQVRAMTKTTQQLQNRSKLLKQTLDQLELNEINSTTLDIMGQCQKVIQKTMVDASQMQALKDKHMQIVISQKQLNDQLEQMKSMDENQIEDEANTMMAQLEQEISKKKKEKQQPQPIPAVHKEYDDKNEQNYVSYN